MAASSSYTALPQYVSGATLSVLAKHEKLRRLGEAVTDVFCAGVDAIFDKWGTQRMSQRMHRITKNVQNTSGEVFQAPYARMHSVLCDQQTKINQLTAQIAAEKGLPQKLAEQGALIDQLQDAIPVLEQRVSEQHTQIQTLQVQANDGKIHAARVAEQDKVISDLQAKDKMLETRVNEQDIMVTELRGALSAGEIELDRQREQGTLLQRQLSDSQKELATLRENAENLVVDLEAAREKAEKLEADLAAARGQMKESEAAKPILNRPLMPPPPRRQSSTSPWGLIATAFLSQPSTPSS